LDPSALLEPTSKFHPVPGKHLTQELDKTCPALSYADGVLAQNDTEKAVEFKIGLSDNMTDSE
jgi:hypothetical protein